MTPIQRQKRKRSAVWLWKQPDQWSPLRRYAWHPKIRKRGIFVNRALIDQLVLLFVGNTPAIFISIWKNYFCLCMKCWYQPFVQQNKSFRVLSTEANHFFHRKRCSYYFCMIPLTFCRPVPLISGSAEYLPWQDGSERARRSTRSAIFPPVRTYALHWICRCRFWHPASLWRNISTILSGHSPRYARQFCAFRILNSRYSFPVSEVSA